MSWNYRVIEKDGYFGLHEVHYDGTDITMCTVRSQVPECESIKALKYQTEKMLAGFAKHTVQYKDVPGDAMPPTKVKTFEITTGETRTWDSVDEMMEYWHHVNEEEKREREERGEEEE